MDARSTPDPGAYYDTADASGSAALLVQRFRLYCDFSGYSDMAIGLAGMLGYKLPLNFNFPVLSRSITELWQRWHISMGQWFMHYVYIPLGGSQRGQLWTLCNLMIVFLLSGLWHGAAWTYVGFGFLQGVITIGERLGGKAALERAPVFVGRLYVNVLWVSTLVVLRGHDLPNAAHVLGRMYGVSDYTGPAGEGALAGAWWWVLLGLAAMHLLSYRAGWPERAQRVPDWLFALLFGAVVALTLPWIPTGAAPFFYFQF